MKRLAELGARRQALVARSAALRERLVDEGQELDLALSTVDRGFGLVRSAVRSPLVMTAAAGGLLLLVKPRNLLKIASRVMLFTSLARRVGALLGSQVTPQGGRGGVLGAFRRRGR